jgi:Glycosyltransferase family 87
MTDAGSGRRRDGFDLRRFVRIALVLFAVLPSLASARAYQNMFAIPGDIEPFTDATTYLAAGERLNAGHSLYGPLGPDDRPVLIDPAFFHSPLLSPPTIAVIWRPIAAVPFGFQAWLVASWMALLAAVAWIVYRTGLVGFAAAVLLSDAIGNQLALGNVTAFFPGLLVLVWAFRERPWVAAIVSLMTAIKITPGALYGWSRIVRSRPAIAWAVGSLAVILVVTAIGAGIRPFADYLGVATDTRPSPASLSGLTGIRWLSAGVLIGGTVLAAAVRRDSWSYAVAVVTMVAGTPSLYGAGFVPLIALLAPLAEANRTAALWPFTWPRFTRHLQHPGPEPT